MPNTRTNQVDQVAALIRRYLDRNPEAADTLEGIRGWWLPSQGYDAPEPLVKEALDKLVLGGELVCVGEPPRSVYRRSSSEDR